MNLIRFFLVLIFMSFAPPSYAEIITGLEIEDFYKDITNLYTDENPDIDKIIALTKRHTADEFTYKNKERTITPLKLDPIIEIITQTRDEFINDIRDDVGRSYNTTLTRTITDIKYLEGKTRADVNFTSLYKGILKKFSKKKNRLMMVKFTTFSQCVENLGLDDEIVKSYRSVCEVETLFTRPKPAE